MKLTSPAWSLRLGLIAGICLGIPFALHAQSKAGWGENQARALQKAKSEHKLVLLNFTGSDWCIWCQKMDQDIFAKPEFQHYARQHLELVEVDFPNAKPLAAEVKKQNLDLQEQYGVQGFPTIVVLNADGKKVGEFEGYQEGGPQAFIDQLAKLPKS